MPSGQQHRKQLFYFSFEWIELLVMHKIAHRRKPKIENNLQVDVLHRSLIVYISVSLVHDMNWLTGRDTYRQLQYYIHTLRWLVALVAVSVSDAMKFACDWLTVDKLIHVQIVYTIWIVRLYCQLPHILFVHAVPYHKTVVSIIVTYLKQQRQPATESEIQ